MPSWMVSAVVRWSRCLDVAIDDASLQHLTATVELLSVPSSFPVGPVSPRDQHTVAVLFLCDSSTAVIHTACCEQVSQWYMNA